jgi:hypothetical protein
VIISGTRRQIQNTWVWGLSIAQWQDYGPDWEEVYVTLSWLWQPNRAQREPKSGTAKRVNMTPMAERGQLAIKEYKIQLRFKYPTRNNNNSFGESGPIPGNKGGTPTWLT